MIYLNEKNVVEIAAKKLAENFMEDPLYVYIFENHINKKEALDIFFNVYLNYLKPCSDIITNNLDMNLIGAVWISDREKNKIYHKIKTIEFIIKLMKLIPIVGWGIYIRLLKTIKTMSSKWIDSQVVGSYIHLDLVVVEKVCRGNGMFSNYLKFVEDTYGKSGMQYTLETQNILNVKKYEHLGFRVVEEIKLPESNLTQYCMIKQYNC